MIETLLVVLHVLLAAGVIGLVLIQHGKGADAGAAFGSGASATVFGARGAASFLTRATSVLATLFFLTSLALAYFAMRAGERPGLVTQAPVPAQRTAPKPVAPELPVVPQGKSEGAPEVPVVGGNKAADPAAGEGKVPPGPKAEAATPPVPADKPQKTTE
jgi:preprotein translocase subunit SecG